MCAEGLHACALIRFIGVPKQLIQGIDLILICVHLLKQIVCCLLSQIVVSPLAKLPCFSKESIQPVGGEHKPHQVILGLTGFITGAELHGYIISSCQFLIAVNPGIVILLELLAPLLALPQRRTAYPQHTLILGIAKHQTIAVIENTYLRKLFLR